jgi:beta-lactamase class A
MIAILKQQRFNEGIPAKLPLGVDVAHKTGWTEKLYHDAGIVYPPGREPYVLVVMTRGLVELDEAPALVAEISDIIFRSKVFSMTAPKRNFRKPAMKS